MSRLASPDGPAADSDAFRKTAAPFTFQGRIDAEYTRRPAAQIRQPTHSSSPHS